MADEIKFTLVVDTTAFKQAVRDAMDEINAEGTPPKPIPEPDKPPVVTQPPVQPQPTNENPIIVEMVNGMISVRALASLGRLKAVLVDTEAHKWTWIGTPQEFDSPFMFKPGWTLNGQRYKILTLDNSKAQDSPVAEGLTEPTVAPASGGAAFALDFIKNQKMGLNIERGRPVRLGLKSDYYNYLKDLGLTHFRFFPPYRFNVNMGWQGTISDGQIAEFLDAVGQSIPAGQVYLDAFDVMGADEARGNWNTVSDYLRRFAKAVAGRGWTPQQVAVGAFNELEGGDNNDFNTIRAQAHGIIRAELPKHLIVHGGAQWNGVQGWENGNWQLPPDDLVIGQVHYYGGPGAMDWALAQKQFQARSAVMRGMPFVLAELGDDFQHMDFDSHWSRWSDLFTDVAKNAGGMRPMLWAMTGEGHDFRLNKGENDAHLQPQVEKLLPKLSKSI